MRVLQKNAIFFGSPHHVANPDASVFIPKRGPIEQYTLFGNNVAFPMGAFSYNHSHTADLRCGRFCSIGNGLRVLGERHPIEWVSTSNITYCFRPDWNKPHFLRAHSELMGGQWSPLPALTPTPNVECPTLEDDVWISEVVTIARGITIGTGAIVGTQAVVTKDVPPYMIVAGNPARPIRQRFSDSICERLLASRWWELHPNVLFCLESRDPEQFLDHIDAVRETVGPSPVKSFTCEDIIREIDRIIVDSAA
jgi:acetyltransferase-like isoleucine patch superfamily enzyme